MKKIYALLIIMIILFAACQPTPEELVVQNKADGELDEMIQQTAETQETAPSAEAIEAEPEYITTSYDYSIKSKDGDVDIYVKANVDIQDGARYQVVRITHKDFSLEFVEKACTVLLEGQEMFEPRKGQTKDEIEAEILSLQAAIANPEQSHSDGLSSGDPETIARVTKMFQDRIKIYKEILEEAPDTIEKVPARFEYMPKKYYAREERYKEDLADYSNETENEQAIQILDEYENEMQLIVDADLSNDYYGRVEVRNYSSKWLNSGHFHFIKSKELNTNTYGPSIMSKDKSESDEIEMTHDEAIIFADKLLLDMGIENMNVSTIYHIASPGAYYDEEKETVVQIPDEERSIYGYNIHYVRQYGPLPVMESSIYYKTAEPDYGPRYGNEELGITIEKDGVIRFSWTNMPQITKVENDNVAILPLEQVMDIFNKQMSIQYNVIGLFDYDENEPDYDELLNSITDARININSIKLKMVRIPVKNQIGEYRMIPAWVFKGNKFFLREGSPNYEDVSDRLDTECFLIINAIDGSIIQ